MSPARTIPHPTWAIALVVLFTLAACTSGSSPSASGGSPTSMPSDSASVEPSAPASGGASESAEPSDGLGPFACNLPIDGVGSTDRAQITDVRVGEHDGYDRIAFEFASGIPPFRIEVGTPPFTRDASGLPLDVAGEYFWIIRLNGGTKVTPDGGITYDGDLEFSPGFTKLVHLIEGGDFEAVSTWHVGMSSESCIRVLPIADPSRLVIDIEH
jgi:hypothetical protein